METRILIFGDKELVYKLHAGARQAQRTRPVLLKVQRDMFRATSALFHSQGRRGGGSWKQLKQDTVRRKGHSTILIDKSDLLRSVTSDNHKYGRHKVTATRIDFGTTAPGARAHFHGYPPRNLPKRQFVKFTHYDTDRWTHMIAEWLVIPFKGNKITGRGRG